MTPNKKSRAERLAEELAQKAFPMSFHDNERNAARWIAKTAYTAAEERARGLVDALENMLHAPDAQCFSEARVRAVAVLKDWEDGK